MKSLFLVALLALAPVPAGAGAAGSPTGSMGPRAPSGAAAAALPAPAAHKLHVSYGSAAVENNVVAVRIRFFRDDLTAALQRHSGRTDFELSVSPDADATFMAYFKDNFSLTVKGVRLQGYIIGSGEDALDREPVWWYAVQFQAPDPVTAFRVTNTLLFEQFDDQRNIVKFVHFPGETQKTYSFARGEESFDVSF